MSDLIRRDEVIKAIKPIVNTLPLGYHSDFASAINSIPSTEPKVGKWKHPHDDEVQCSICGYLTNWIEDTDIHGMGIAVFGEKYANYCPNCGAKMDGEREGE